jgi:hypothetical protein
MKLIFKINFRVENLNEKSDKTILLSNVGSSMVQLIATFQFVPGVFG